MDSEYEMLLDVANACRYMVRNDVHNPERLKISFDNGFHWKLWNPFKKDDDCFRVCIDLGIRVLEEGAVVKSRLIATSDFDWMDTFCETSEKINKYQAARTCVMILATRIARKK